MFPSGPRGLGLSSIPRFHFPLLSLPPPHYYKQHFNLLGPGSSIKVQKKCFDSSIKKRQRMQTLKHLLVKARGAGERNCRPQIRQMSVRRRLRIPKPLFTKSLLRKLREPKALNTWQRTPPLPQRPRWGGKEWGGAGASEESFEFRFLSS